MPGVPRDRFQQRLAECVVSVTSDIISPVRQQLAFPCTPKLSPVKSLQHSKRATTSSLRNNSAIKNQPRPRLNHRSNRLEIVH